MSNPFRDLKAETEHVYDEWGGQFSCQTIGCYKAVPIAKYFKKLRLLAWECPDGHRSMIEDVDE